MTWEEYKAMKNKDSKATIAQNEVRTSKNSIEGMSWEEYKQKRNEQRQREEAEEKQREEQNTKKKKNVLDRAGYLAKNAGAGLLGGITGLGQGVLLDTANQMNEGANSNRTAMQLGLNTINSLANIANPMSGITNYIKNIPGSAKETIDVLTDKNKNALQKTMALGLNANSNAQDMVLPVSISNSMNQLVGKLNPKTVDSVLAMNEKIASPVRNLRESIANEGTEYGAPTRWLGSGVQSMTNMIPSIVATTITKNPSFGLGVMGLSAKGQSTQEALDNGASLKLANQIGDAKELTEIGTEMLTGGLKVFGKGKAKIGKKTLDDFITNKVDEKIKNKTYNFIAKNILGIMGEQSEEVISDLVGLAIDKGTIDPNAKYTWKDFAETLITTAISTGGLNAINGSYSKNAYLQNAAEMQQANQLPTANQVEVAPKVAEVAPRASEVTANTEAAPVANEENTYSNKLKQIATDEINKSSISSQDKTEMLNVLNGLDTVSDADIEAIRNTIQGIRESQQLETKGDYKNDQTRRQKYMQYKNDTSTYDSTAVDEVLDAIPQNRNGRRTVKQWLQVADEIGKKIANLSNEEIEKIAYKSWFDIQPSKSITQYDRQAKQQVGFQKFTSDEWINTINNAVNEARNNNQMQENTSNTSELPVINQEKVVETTGKSDSQVKQEVFDYLKRNNINMSTEEFMEWASNKQLEQEDNMTSQQQELYSLINDIQNRKNDLIMGENSKTSDKNKLNIAIQMKQNQSTNEEIYKKTGWYLGGEGKWKSEINDKNFKVKENVQKNTKYWLNDIFEAPELYQAYSDLKNVSVSFMNLPADVGGGYNILDDSIIINNSILDESSTKKKKVFLHEIQHAIQHREGFEGGSNVLEWEKKKTNLKNKIDDINNNIELIHNAIGLEEFRNNLLDKMGNNSNINYWEEIEKFENSSKYAKELKELNKNKEKYIQEYLKIKNRDNIDLYENTAGEQEAIDVEKRSEYRDEQRKQILPLVKNEKTVYNKSNMSMKEGLSNVESNNEGDKYKTYSAGDNRIGYTGNDRLSSKNNNKEEGKRIYETSNKESTTNKRTVGENIKQNNVENSNESSFNLPKDVKEIKNLNQFLREMTEKETDKYWKDQLMEAKHAGDTGWTRRESPLHWKRGLVQQYLDYKNSSVTNAKDSQGRTLTKEQQEHYKESKVRDKEGNLLVVYHGTPTGGFTIYDNSKLGKTTGAKDSTLGIHFTDNLEMAETYKDYVTDEIYEQAKKEIYEKYNIKKSEILPFDMESKINKEIDSLAKSKVKETAEVKEQYLNIKKPMSIFADYGINEEQLANDLVYALTGSYDITDTTDYFENNQDFLLGIQQNFNNELAEMKDELAKSECVNRLKELGYDGVILPLQSTDKVGLAQLGMNTKGNEYIVFNSNQAKNIDNNNPTLNPDIRYELEDTSNNTEENEIQRKINRSMTMQEAKDMIQRAFVSGNIYDWFDGEYKNGDEWLAGEGAEQVALIIDNDFQLQSKYVNNNQDILNEEYIIEDVIEAYENGTLTGNSNKITTRLDTSKETGYKDERFYAPKDIQGGKDLYNIASQRVTNANRQEVYKARADFILNAHNKGYIESLGLTQKEVNENLRKWASYPKRAMDISNSINEGVAKENRWTGIENSSIVNELSVSQEQLDSLVKEIKGTTNEWQRRYISNTMLALDTHLDYKGLTYDFAPDVSSMSKNALADYFSEDDTIRVRREGQNTIAHETGHFIDHLLGRKIGDGYNLGITTLCRSNIEWTEANTDKKYTAAQKQFLNNFNNFLTSIEDVSDIGSSYKMSSNEVFARFVARFTEWTRNVATGNRYGYESKWYDDHFTQSQYREFAKLLQEYSLLETTGQVSNKIDRSKAKKYDQKIDDIYSELFKTTPTADNKLATNEYTEKQSKVKEQEQIAKILDEPITKEKEKSRVWAITKANLIDKGIVFEELSHKTKNRELQGKWDYMLTSGARGQNAIGQARYDMDSNNKTKKQISKSLEDIRTEVGKNTSQFQNYMYHQLNIDRMTLQERFGKDNKPVFGDNISAEYSRQKVAEFEKAHPEFKEYAQDVYDFLDANKKELVDRGVISQELSDKLHELYPHYVPIKRVDAKGAAIKVPLDTFRTGVNTPLAKATGGSSDIQPMFQTIADRTLQTYRASARNNFGVELMNTLNSTTESMQTDIDSIIEEIGDENTELLKEGKNGQNPTFTVFNNGEKVTFEITKDMYDALKPQSDIIKNINNSKLAKAGRAISNFRRGVLTEYNPIFSLTNAMKDAQDVVVNSQHPAKTFAKFGESYAQILQKGYWYNEYIQNGGAQNSYFKDGEFQSDKKQSKLKSAIKVPFEAISNVNNVIEMAPRLAEYIASREAGKSIETSMLDAARVTTNFKAGGDWTKTLNRNGATFLNASVQGFQQQVRNIQEAHVKGLKGYAALATKYAIAGLPALLLNGLIWKDDEDYNNLQDYAKDNYYIIAKYGDGKFIRIPKGRVAATAQKIVSNAAEYLTDDKKSLNIDNLAKDFWEDIKFAQDNIAPNNPLNNNVLSPIKDIVTNKTWYGSDLVPTRLQNKPKKEQYDETTDSLSIWLGDKLNVSPYKINYLLDQYGGGLADITLPRMTKQAENNVFTDKFTTDSVMKNKYPGEFYSELDDLKIKANSIDAKDEDVLKYKYNSSVSSQMSKLYAEKREIQNSNMTDKQKKEQLKVVQGKINNLAREALEGTDTAKISGNTATINDTQYYKTTADDESKWNKVTDKEKEKNQDISLTTYADYKNKVIGKSKDSEKIQILVDSSYSNKEKLALYENYVNSNDKNISLVKDLDINTDEYLKYKLNAGTKKAEKVSYIENTMRNVSYMNKLMLLGTEYALSSSEKDMVYNYVTGLNKTKAQKLEILSKIKGFTVSDNGTVRY